MLSGGVGSEEAGFGTFRYGFRAGDTTIRGFVKWFDRREARLAPPLEGDAGDAWHIGTWGGRLDTDLGTSDTLTIMGEGYRGSVGEAAPIASLEPPYSVVREFDQPVSGANLTARWQHAFSETSNFQLQAYYDRTRRDDLRALFRLDTFDLDFQHRLQWHAGRLRQNDLVWGLGYRFHRFDSEPGASLDLVPRDEDLRQSSAFVSNDTTLFAGRLHAIVGSKFEHTTFTGFEIEPSARVLFSPNADTGVWGAVSRAIRIPSLIERNGRFDIQTVPPGPLPLPSLLQFTGDSGFGSEKLLAYEAGYRRRVSGRIAADIALFYNRYADLRDGAAQSPSLDFAPAPHFVVPVVVNNNLAGETYGFESLMDFDSMKGWKLRGSYSFLRVETRQHSGGASVTGSSTLLGLAPPEFDEPRHQAYLRWAVTIRQVEIDMVPRFVSSLRNLGVPSYAELDAQLGWRPSRRLEIAVAGRNLGHSTHQEFINANGGPVPALIQREATLKATIRF